MTPGEFFTGIGIIALGFMIFDAAAFALAFLGKIGTTHHAWHVLIAAGGIEGVLAAVFTVVMGIWFLDEAS